MNPQNLYPLFPQTLRKTPGFVSIFRCSTFLTALLIILLTMPYAVGAASVPPPAPAAAAQGPADVKELEAFMDQVIEGNLEAYDIPGATVSVVKDGRLLLAKGYGLANVEKQIPVDAERSLFRIGSTSKLFTWTAVMQLVEQGKLDLDQDVNTYLHGFQIPATYAQPITLRHLMTHTAGFEERVIGMWAKEAGTMASLEEYLIHYMPARVRPPGQLTAYSNYGAALAGYIVSIVSGMSFETYIEENIYRPLGMTHSTFRQSLPAELADDVAIGYSVKNGALKPEPFEYLSCGPEGAMSSTAQDMARFMIAHLQDGRYDDSRILRQATAQQMHSRQFANDPRLNGFTLGFFDKVQNQQHILEHGGGTWVFHTQMALLPEQNLGIFISYNADKGMVVIVETFQAFLDHYYPTDNAPEFVPMLDFAEKAERYAGQYRITRSNYAKIERVLYLSGVGYGQISANPDGTLSFTFQTPRGTFTQHYIEVAPLVFQEIDGTEKLIFKEDTQGRITNLFINSAPHYAWEKIVWYGTAWFSRLLLLACLAIFLSILPTFWLQLVVTRRRPDLPRLVAFGTSLLALGLVAGFALNIGAIAFEITPAMKIVLGLSLAMPFLAFFMVFFTAHAWATNKWGLVARIHYSIVSVTAVAFVWMLNAWNVLGFRL